MVAHCVPSLCIKMMCLLLLAEPTGTDGLFLISAFFLSSVKNLQATQGENLRAVFDTFCAVASIIQYHLRQLGGGGVRGGEGGCWGGPQETLSCSRRQRRQKKFLIGRRPGENFVQSLKGGGGVMLSC